VVFIRLSPFVKNVEKKSKAWDDSKKITYFKQAYGVVASQPMKLGWNYREFACDLHMWR
jgi:hypothetical protein